MTTTNDQPDPEAFLKALLAINPEDAKEVREVADTKAKPDASRAEPTVKPRDQADS